MSLLALAEACREWAPFQDARLEPLVAIAATWPQIVGPQVAEHSRPLEIRGQTLVVVTRSQSWTHQLSFMTRQMLEALMRDAPEANITQVRFRVGRIVPSTSSKDAPQVRRRISKRSADARPPTQSLAEALDRFRQDVTEVQRAKAAGGAAFCRRCGVVLSAGHATCCLPCAQAEREQRQRAVARLLFEAPWLGFEGIAALVEGLTEREYGAVRIKLLRRWWETLQRTQRARRLSPHSRERLIASSYVILKSGLEPEQIVPAVVRNLLGDELHDLIYGISN